MASMDKRRVYFAPEGDGGTGGGTGGGDKGGGASFADAAAGRTFLQEWVPDADLLKSVPDDKVLQFATHVKTRVDGFGKQFPETWRQLVAGDNAEHLKTLERFQSPKALYESYGALRAKMASGELRSITPFPEKGNDAEKTAWRAANGIPEAAEEYVKGLKLPNGIVVGEADKPLVDGFAKRAHERNIPPAAVNEAISFFLEEQSNRAAAASEAEAGRRMATEDALRAEWGADYRGNVARITALLDGAPKGVKEVILGARGPDGGMIANHPETLRWLVDIARQTNPAGIVLPGSGGNLAQSIDEEIKEIEKFMREDRTAYNKDEKKQGRLRDLYDARDRAKGQKAA